MRECCCCHRTDMLGYTDDAEGWHCTRCLMAERDEARAAAQQFYEAAALWGQFPTPQAKAIWGLEMVNRWPWLKPR